MQQTDQKSSMTDTSAGLVTLVINTVVHLVLIMHGAEHLFTTASLLTAQPVM
jgi:hypothetical protein